MATGTGRTPFCHFLVSTGEVERAEVKVSKLFTIPTHVSDVILIAVHAIHSQLALRIVDLTKFTSDTERNKNAIRLPVATKAREWSNWEGALSLQYLLKSVSSLSSPLDDFLRNIFRKPGVGA